MILTRCKYGSAHRVFSCSDGKISCITRPAFLRRIAADAKHLHHTIFIKTANSVCRGAGDSHLPRSMRARSPHVLSPVGGSTANGRGTKFREPTGIAHDHREFRLRRPACAAGLRQMQSTCTGIFLFFTYFQKKISFFS